MTGPAGSLRALWRASIWHPAAIPPGEMKFSSLKRVWWPVYDVLAVIAGIVGAVYGVPALDATLPDPVVDLLGYALAVVATVCLMGVVFPALWRVEIIARPLLAGILGSYVIALILLAGQGIGTREFVTVIAAMTLPMTLFRAWMLGIELAGRSQHAA